MDSNEQRYESKQLKKCQNLKNLSELEMGLGMVAYVAKFIPNFSNICTPLRDLKAWDEWKWTTEHEQAFQALKQSLTQHYDSMMSESP